jgi:hypothetical protein
MSGNRRSRTLVWRTTFALVGESRSRGVRPRRARAASRGADPCPSHPRDVQLCSAHGVRHRALLVASLRRVFGCHPSRVDLEQVIRHGVPYLATIVDWKPRATQSDAPPEGVENGRRNGPQRDERDPLVAATAGPGERIDLGRLGRGTCRTHSATSAARWAPQLLLSRRVMGRDRCDGSAQPWNITGIITFLRRPNVITGAASSPGDQKTQRAPQECRSPALSR